MTADFVASLRSRRGAILVGALDGTALDLRVQIPELWDVVRVQARPSTPVREVKTAVLADLLPAADQASYVMKLRGFEVLDESLSLGAVGVVAGSIFLLTNRRRRPVRCARRCRGATVLRQARTAPRSRLRRRGSERKSHAGS